MDKYIACTTKKQWKEVLKALEEDGYKWCVGNSVLSGLDYFSSYKSGSVIHVHPDTKTLEFGGKDFYKGCGIKTFISAQEFLIGVRTKPIVISRNGNTVTAENKNTGDKGIAICSPEDTFDFKVGAMLALARLCGCTTKSDTCDDEIREGDIVEVTEPLLCYDTYAEWLLENIDSTDLRVKFVFRHIPRTETPYRVIKIASHTIDKDIPLAYIQDTENSECYIVNVDGLKRVEK